MGKRRKKVSSGRRCVFEIHSVNTPLDDLSQQPRTNKGRRRNFIGRAECKSHFRLFVEFFVCETPSPKKTPKEHTYNNCGPRSTMLWQITNWIDGVLRHLFGTIPSYPSASVVSSCCPSFCSRKFQPTTTTTIPPTPPFLRQKSGIST